MKKFVYIFFFVFITCGLHELVHVADCAVLKPLSVKTQKVDIKKTFYLHSIQKIIAESSKRFQTTLKKRKPKGIAPDLFYLSKTQCSKQFRPYDKLTFIYHDDFVFHPLFSDKKRGPPYIAA